LRKDFPLSGFFDIYYDSINNVLLYTVVKSIQEFRYFRTLSPWEYYHDSISYLHY